MNWRSKKILVTGAAGFIGSHLVEQLILGGAHVRAFVRYNSRNDRGNLEKLPAEIRNAVEICVGDLKDPSAVYSAVRGIDIIFHLGALIAIPYSYVNPMDFVQTNIVGTANLLSAVNKLGVERLVHTSTSEVYGTLHYSPIDESHPIEGKSPYAASKIAADQLMISHHRAFGLPITIIRPFNTYGPRQSLRAIIPTIICQAFQGKEIRLGATEPTRDFNYVLDTVSGMMSAVTIEQTIGEIINLGTGREISIGRLSALILGILGKSVPIRKEAIRLRPKRSEVYRLVCDNSKALRMMEWKPRFSLEQGLELTIEWLRHRAPSKHETEYVI